MFLSVGDALFKNAPHNVWFYWYEKSFIMGIYLGFQIFLTVQDKIAKIIPHNVRFPFTKIFHCEEVSWVSIYSPWCRLSSGFTIQKRRRHFTLEKQSLHNSPLCRLSQFQWEVWWLFNEINSSQCEILPPNFSISTVGKIVFLTWFLRCGEFWWQYPTLWGSFFPSPQCLPHNVKLPHSVGPKFVYFPTTLAKRTQMNLYQNKINY